MGLTGLGAQPLLAGAGLAVFSAAMFVGRMSGDAIIDRLGHVGAIRTGVAFAALGGGAGLGAAHLLGDPLVGVAGFAAFGLGLSVVFPATLALAGSRAADSERASAIALTTSGGYIGASVGPPLIGAIAQSTSVSAALLTLPALTALALLLSTLRVPRTPRPALRSAPLAAATATLRTSIPVAPYPHWAAHDRRGSIWLANHDSNAVTRVDTQTLSVGEDDVVPDVGISPHAIAVSPDSTRVAVVSFDSDELRLFDTGTGTVLQSYPVGRSPQDVAWTADGARLLTADVEDDRVSVVDAATGQVTAALTPPISQSGAWDGPTSVARHP